MRLMNDDDVGVEHCVVVIYLSEGRRYERRSTRFDVSRLRTLTSERQSWSASGRSTLRPNNPTE